jgi:hypothetical protein
VTDPGSAQAVGSGLVLFLALSALGTLTGLGTLRLCGKPEELDLRVLAAPAAATITWGLTGGVATVLGVPAKSSVPWVWALTGLLATAGGWWLWRHHGWVPRGRRAVAVTVGALLIAAVLPWWPLFARGLTAHVGNHNLDTFNLTAAAAYYWRFGARPPASLRDADGFYRLVYDQNVLNFGEGRMGPAVLLAQLSTLVQPGEPVLARNLLVCWLLLVMAATSGLWAVAAYRRLAGGAPGATWPVACVALTITVGWGAVPALVGNWDNALLVCVAPLAGALLLESRPTWGWGVLLGLAGAYGMYVFPEVTPFLCAVLLPLAARDPAGGRRGRDTIRPLAVAGLVASVLMLPGLGGVWKVYAVNLRLFAAGTPGSAERPGGFFAYGLLERPWDPGAWWALGPDWPGAGFSTRAAVVGGLLVALLALGVAHRARERFRGDAAGVLIAVLLAGCFVWIARYSYPAYKILSVSAWLVMWCVTEAARVGLRAIAADAVAMRRLGWVGPAMLVASLVGGGVLCAAARLRHYFPPEVHRRQPPARALIELREAGRGQPDGAALVSLADRFLAQPWILYALRDSRLSLYVRPPAYASGERPAPRQAAIPAVLIPSDRAWAYQGQRPLLETRDFRLLSVDPLAVLADIEAPDGIDADGIWLGARSVVLAIRALDAARVALVLDVGPDPGLPEPARSQVRVTASGQEIERPVTARADVRVEVTLPAGWQRVELGVRPAVVTLASGAARPARVRVHGIRLGATPAGPPPRP